MTKTILAGLALLVPVACRAADELKPFDAKPGLWETATKIEMPGMPSGPLMPQIPEETLAKMPPAQRAQVEAMLKLRSAAGPTTTTSKVCMTPESLSRAGAFIQSNKSCTSKVVSASPDRQEIHVDCVRGKARTSGDMVVERVDAGHVKGAMDMKTLMEGAPQATQVKMNFDTKWVSADCGDVKPFVEK